MRLVVTRKGHTQAAVIASDSDSELARCHSPSRPAYPAHTGPARRPSPRLTRGVSLSQAAVWLGRLRTVCCRERAARCLFGDGVLEPAQEGLVRRSPTDCDLTQAQALGDAVDPVH